MAQRSLIDMMNAVSTNSDSEFRDSDFPPLPPGEAPKAAEQPQGGAAAGRRRPRKDVEKMTASPATSKQRESRLTHENLGSDPGAPPPQLSIDAKKKMIILHKGTEEHRTAGTSAPQGEPGVPPSVLTPQSP